MGAVTRDAGVALSGARGPYRDRDAPARGPAAGPRPGSTPPSTRPFSRF